MPKDTRQEADEPYVVNLQKLRAELDRIHSKKQSSGEASSTLGQQRKGAAESLGVHKDALSIIERIDGMSDEKMSDFMRTFEPLFEAILPQWKERIVDMLDRAEADAADMESDMDD